MYLDTCQGITFVQVTYNQSIIFQNNNVYFYFYRFLLFCTRLTFDLVLWPRVIYRLGIHPYEFGHMPRNIMSIGRIMYSKMPTKPKLSHFFGFGLPSTGKFVDTVDIFSRKRNAVGVNISGFAKLFHEQIEEIL